MIKELYRPASELDKSLLASIPMKVFSWLTFLDKVEDKQFQDLYWEFTPEKSTIFIDGEHPTQIWVEGPITKPDDICGVESWMTDISNNLNPFMAYEKRIYDILEELTEDVRAEAEKKND